MQKRYLENWKMQLSQDRKKLCIRFYNIYVFLFFKYLVFFLY